MLQKILHHLRAHKKSILLGVIICSVFSTSSVLANTQQESELVGNALWVINVIQAMVLVFVGPATIIAGWLLSPDWTFGDFFGLRPHLYGMWVLVSNVVYTIFAIVLVGVALANIFSSQESYALKKMLPRFVIGILMVPFSWFLVSFTLSIANAATAAVMSIPMSQISADSDFYTKETIPKRIEIGTRGENSNDPGSLTCSTEGSCISPGELLLSDQGAFGMLAVYTYDIFRVSDHQFKTGSDFCSESTESGSGVDQAVGCISKFFHFILEQGMFVIFSLVFSVLLLALTAVLLVRAVYLWIFTILSPIFGLLYFLGDMGKERTQALTERFSISKLIQLAFVPFFVGAVLSMGILMMYEIKSSIASGGGGSGSSFSSIATTTDSGEKFCTTGNWAITLCHGQEGDSEDMLSMFVGGTDGVELAFGPVYDDLRTVSDAGGDEVVSELQDAFSYIFLNLLALIFIWVGVISALNVDKLTNAVVDPFKQFGQGIASLAKEMPKMARIPGAQGATMGGLLKAPDTIRSGITSRINEGIPEFAKNFSNGVTGFNKAVRDFESMNIPSAARDVSAAKLLHNMEHVSSASKVAESWEKKGMVTDKTKVEHYIKEFHSNKGNKIAQDTALKEMFKYMDKSKMKSTDETKFVEIFSASTSDIGPNVAKAFKAEAFKDLSVTTDGNLTLRGKDVDPINLDITSSDSIPNLHKYITQNEKISSELKVEIPEIKKADIKKAIQDSILDEEDKTSLIGELGL